uniref:Uncharacterized protein n=1 Tax=Oryza punctata TaxID=4537 RepID=A0A0E0JQS9_ORYPU
MSSSLMNTSSPSEPSPPGTSPGMLIVFTRVGYRIGWAGKRRRRRLLGRTKREGRREEEERHCGGGGVPAPPRCLPATSWRLGRLGFWTSLGFLPPRVTRDASEAMGLRPWVGRGPQRAGLRQ